MLVKSLPFPYDNPQLNISPSFAFLSQRSFSIHTESRMHCWPDQCPVFVEHCHAWFSSFESRLTPSPAAGRLLSTSISVSLLPLRLLFDSERRSDTDWMALHHSSRSSGVSTQNIRSMMVVHWEGKVTGVNSNVESRIHQVTHSAATKKLHMKAHSMESR